MNIIGIAFIVIIVCSIYLYNDYAKNNSNSKHSELSQGSGIVVLSALLGGFFALLLFLILQPMFSATDTQDYIVVATIILSAVICGCTALVVKTLKNLTLIKKDE